MIHVSTIEDSQLGSDIRQNIERIITPQTYRAYELACTEFGTSDLVVMINGNAPDGEIARNGIVFTRAQLLADPTFPQYLRERIGEPARLSNLTAQTFWAIVLWNKAVAALAVGVQSMSRGGDA